MDLFNNREIAGAIWIAILIAWGARSPGVKKAFRAVLGSFAKWVILVPLAMMAVYIAMMVYRLHTIGLWGVALLKSTVLWTVAVAAASLFRIGSIADDLHYYWHAIKDSFRIIVFFGGGFLVHALYMTAAQFQVFATRVCSH